MQDALKKTTRILQIHKDTIICCLSKHTGEQDAVCVCVCIGFPDNSELLGGSEVPGEVSESATQTWTDVGCGWVTVQC